MPRIPWAAILTHGPAIVAAAKKLFANASASHEKQPIEARIGQLEKASIESAGLLQEMAQQIQALTIEQAQTARRVRIAIALAVVSLIVGIGAGILAVI